MTSEQQTQSYDAIVIGAGLNGLVCAAYLARAGRAVAVLSHTGPDMLDYGEPWPGKDGTSFPVPPGPDVTLPTSLLWDLDLERYGLRFEAPRSVAVYTRNAVLVRDADATAMDRRLRAVSPSEADAYRNYRALIRRQRSYFDQLIAARRGRPPRRSDLMDILRQAGQDGMVEAVQLLTGSIRDVLNSWMEMDALRKAVLAGALDGPFAGMGLGPFSPTSAFGLLFDPLSLQDLESRDLTRRVRGGRDALYRILLRYIRDRGGVLVRDTKVKEITRQKGRVTGVALDGEQTLKARVVVCDLDVKRVAFSLMDWKELPETLSSSLATWRSRAQVAQVNLVLSGEPRLPDVHDGFLPMGSLAIIDSLVDVERAFDSWKDGELPARPPIRFDLTGERDGVWYARAVVHYVPGALAEGEWNDATKIQIIGRVVKALSDVSPGFETLLRDARVVTPMDWEKRYGLVGGHHLGGETAFDQILFHRPTPDMARGQGLLKGLHLAGLAQPQAPFVDGGEGLRIAEAILNPAGWGAHL